MHLLFTLRQASRFLALTYYSQYCPLEVLFCYLSLAFGARHITILADLELIKK